MRRVDKTPGSRIVEGDCIERMREMPDSSIDAIVCDPPYGLEFMGNEWDKLGGDAGMTKPGIGERSTAWPSYGGSQFGGANPTCATCGGRARGKKQCACEQPDWRVKGKPLTDGFRRVDNPADVGRDDVFGRTSARAPEYHAGRAMQEWHEAWAREALRVAKPGAHLLAFGGTRTYHRLACAIEDAGFEIRDRFWTPGGAVMAGELAWLYGSGFPKSRNLDGEWKGWGTALKPAHEPIVVARKPFVGTVAANVARHGTGALNIDGCRLGTGGGGARDGEASAERRYAGSGSTNFAPTPGPRGGDARGRWPANVALDEASAAMLDAQPRGLPSGGASRFFYCAKASKRERNGGVPDGANVHPTVKPIALMRWLVRLVTPPGGTVLDPFLGSGTTGCACAIEGFDFVGIERDPQYVKLAGARIAYWTPKPTEPWSGPEQIALLDDDEVA